MNKKLIFALLNYKSKESGFTTALAVGLGLVMLLVGTTMMLRSQGSQANSFLQKETALSLGIAEGGMTRSLSKLNSGKYSDYLKYSYDPNGYLGTAVNEWENPVSLGLCTVTPDALQGDVTGKVAAGDGEYELLAYRYNSGDETSQLLVKSTKSSAESKVQVKVNLEEAILDNSFPGVYASEVVSLGGNSIIKTAGGSGDSANVICRDCYDNLNSGQKSGITLDCENGFISKETALDIMQASDVNNVDGNAYIYNVDLPTLPSAPTQQCSSTAPKNQECYIPINPISGAMTLPRPTDVTDRATWLWSDMTVPYHYVIGNYSNTNQDSITMTGNTAILTADTSIASIRIYADRDVKLAGGGGSGTSVVHNGSPERLALFGTGGTDQDITINGGAQAINMFIFAPKATVGVNGGSSDPDLVGVVWSDTWNGSSSGNVAIEIPDGMAEKLSDEFGGSYNVGIKVYSTSAPKNWRRTDIDTN